jgi:hypothetical protein
LVEPIPQVGIQEDSWADEALNVFNCIFIDFASELQDEPGAPSYIKPDGVTLCEEMPPTRILSLVVPLTAWLGWVSHRKNGDVYFSQNIADAFEYRRNLSMVGEIP